MVLTRSLLLSVAVSMAATAMPLDEADAQACDAIRRAIEKNVELQVRRLRTNLGIENSADSVPTLDIGGEGRFPDDA